MGPNGIKPVTILDFLAKVRESKLQSSNIYLTVIFHFESRSVIDLSTFDAIAKMVEIWYQDFEVPLKKSLFSFSVFIKINKICDIAILKYVFKYYTHGMRNKFKILLKRYDFIINIKKETMSSHFPEISNTMYICLYQLKKKNDQKFIK